MTPSLLDTDILSELWKLRDPVVQQNASKYLSEHQTFALSAISRYEVIRGHRLRSATVQEAKFNLFCQHCVVVAISDAILDRAADLCVIAHRKGLARNDADLIIAATAIEHGRTLVTGNTSHFASINRLAVQDWRLPG